MASSDEIDALNKAFSGLGVDEKSLVSILGKWDPQQRQSFRKGFNRFFSEDERQFERWEDKYIALLNREFLRFKSAMVLWTMHPWERDARLLKDALQDGPKSYNVIIEIASTRSSEQLLGARRAYHSIYNHSIEEDVAFNVHGTERKLLVALVSSYHYEGPVVKEDIAKAEAKVLSEAIKSAGKSNPIADEEVVRILTTRSKGHLAAVYKDYKEITGHYIDEELNAEPLLLWTVQCRCKPQVYFAEVLELAMESGADENTKEGLTRVIVTRADSDVKQIKEEYQQQYGAELRQKITDVANGSYRDFLLNLLARGGDQ